MNCRKDILPTNWCKSVSYTHLDVYKRQTVGGGINELSDVDRLLNAGADKISINSSAIRNPQLIDEIAKNFGSQVCVLAVDAKQTENGWKCYLNGGRIEPDTDLFEWTKEAQERGAGEILFTLSLIHI